MFGRRNHRISNDIIDERRAGRAGKAQIRDLNRRWPQRQNAPTYAARMAVEVHQQIDVLRLDLGGDVLIGQIAALDRMVELLLGQLKRRRNKNVKIDVQQEDKLNVVL